MQVVHCFGKKDSENNFLAVFPVLRVFLQQFKEHGYTCIWDSIGLVSYLMLTTQLYYIYTCTQEHIRNGQLEYECVTPMDQKPVVWSKLLEPS